MGADAGKITAQDDQQKQGAFPARRPAAPAFRDGERPGAAETDQHEGFKKGDRIKIEHVDTRKREGTLEYHVNGKALIKKD